MTVSLNSDQINALAMRVDERFDMNSNYGFKNAVPISSRVAADALLDQLDEESLVRILELVLESDGAFVYDSVVKVKFKEALIDRLGKLKWIYDKDSARFFRDPFTEERLNILKKISVIDLCEGMSEHDVASLAHFLCDSSQRLRLGELSWQLTVKIRKMTDDRAGLLHELVALLVNRHEIDDFTRKLHESLLLLAMNALTMMYRSLLEQNAGGQPAEDAPAADSSRLVVDRLLSGGDEAFVALASNAGSHVDLQFKSSDGAVSVWTSHRTPLTYSQKRHLAQKLGFLPDTYDQDPDDAIDLRIFRVLETLRQITPDPQPLKVVFYPAVTKIGFVLKRADLRAYQIRHDALRTGNLVNERRKLKIGSK